MPSRDSAGIHRSPMEVLTKRDPPFSVVLKVSVLPSLVPEKARQKPLTKVHHRMALATLANHSGPTCLRLRT